MTKVEQSKDPFHSEDEITWCPGCGNFAILEAIKQALGELNKQGYNNEELKSDLFVNLRCMQIKDNQAHLYMGCGITKDSIPEKEWKESVNKSMTMKRVL